MSKCQKYIKLSIGAFYKELNDRDREAFDAHIKECPKCAAEYNAMKLSLEVLKHREKREPTPEYWEELSSKIELKISEEEKRRKPQPNVIDRLMNWYELVPKWSYQLAAAVILVLIGVLIGKYIFDPKEITHSPVRQMPPDSQYNIQHAAVEERAYNYLERSKILLLGIVNMDTDVDQSSIIDYSKQRQVARTLIQEATFIQDDLSVVKNQRLRKLVSDLEVILLQIANLESDNDLPAVDMIRLGVEKKSIFLKINLAEMQRQNMRMNKEPTIQEKDDQKEI